MYEDALIEDLFIPFSAVLTDVTSGEPMVHRRGPVWLAVRASSSLPGAWPAVQLDGKLLVDGGLLNNLPVDVIQPRCKLGAIIASDIARRKTPANTHRMGLTFPAGAARGNVPPIVAKTECADDRRAARALRLIRQLRKVERIRRDKQLLYRAAGRRVRHVRDSRRTAGRNRRAERLRSQREQLANWAWLKVGGPRSERADYPVKSVPQADSY